MCVLPSSIIVLLQDHGVNHNQRYFPSPHPIGSQYDISPWPVFIDVCFIYVLNVVQTQKNPSFIIINFVPVQSIFEISCMTWYCKGTVCVLHTLDTTWSLVAANTNRTYQWSRSPLTGKLQHLSEHHFATKKQSEFCKTVKLKLEELTSVTVVEFAEGYTCLFQDAAQDFHWHSIRVTLHSHVFYTRNKTELESLSLRFISAELEHYTNTFLPFKKLLWNILKEQHRT